MKPIDNQSLLYHLLEKELISHLLQKILKYCRVIMRNDSWKNLITEILVNTVSLYLKLKVYYRIFKDTRILIRVSFYRILVIACYLPILQYLSVINLSLLTLTLWALFMWQRGKKWYVLESVTAVVKKLYLRPPYNNVDSIQLSALHEIAQDQIIQALAYLRRIEHAAHEQLAVWARAQLRVGGPPIELHLLLAAHCSRHDCSGERAIGPNRDLVRTHLLLQRQQWSCWQSE